MSTERSNSSASSASVVLDEESPTTTAAKTLTLRTRKSKSSTPTLDGYTHTPSLPLLAWLIVSLPIVAWDTLYVQLRPHTMPGGKLHSPVWTPYALYGATDHIYGWPAWNDRNGFSAAQSAMNVPESAFYCWYLYVVGRQVVDWSYNGIGQLEVKGEGVNLAVLLGFSGAVMTLSKSLLYWLNEAFSDFKNIGHNSLYDLIVLWIIPNGLWIVLPSYMIYVLGKDILESMGAGGNAKRAEK